MGKKKGGKSSGYQSKGERPNVSKWCTKAMRRDYLANNLLRALNQLTAHKNNKRVMVTIPNPNTNETNKRFIRVPTYQVWGPNKVFKLTAQNTAGEE
jgi:hypothetical protein